ncbi:MAG TPA: FAD:protein FMN transferase [Clostridiales bacterium]|nr:FAD:protein FMN transferase [Clostridiales bacterium]
MKRKRALIIALIYLISLFGFVSCNAGRKRYEAQFLQLFDTVTTIVSFADSKEEFNEFSVFIYDTLKEYHQLFDIYNDYEGINNIKTINDNAGKNPVKVDQRIIDLLLFAKQGYEKTKGKVNIALGSVLKIWHDYREKGIDDPENAKLPPMDELKAAKEHTDINNLVINQEESTVYLTDPEMSIDVGAIGKGYAVEQVAKKAEEKGYTSALLSVGGNVRAIGSKDGKGKPWNIGVENPEKTEDGSPLLVTEIVGKSVVTSGIYQRYYTVDGKNYHHIIDPDTLMPHDNFKSVTIICDDSGMADMLSTAVFNMPFDEGLRFVNSLQGVEAVWVLMDGQIKYSDNFQQYLSKQA